MTHYLARDSKKTMTGVVKGGKLALTNNTDDSETLVPWNDEAGGFWTQYAICAKKKIELGDSFKATSMTCDSQESSPSSTPPGKTRRSITWWRRKMAKS